MRPFATIFLTGGATLIIAIALGIVLPQSANLADGYVTPIIAFEFARQSSDLAFLLGSDLKADEIRKAMRLGLLIDFVFPLAYTGLLIAVWLRITGTATWSSKIVIIIGSLIVPLDYYENYRMLILLDQAQNTQITQHSIDSLHIATWAKWGTIALMIGLLSWQLALRTRWLPALLGLVVVLVSTACLVSDTSPVLAERMSQSIGLFFLVLFTTEIVVWWRNRSDLDKN